MDERTRRVLHSSEKQDWRTPEPFFNRLHARFGFTVDASASDENAMLPRYWTKEIDGLAQDWTPERVWCNPEYKRGSIEPWLEKGFMSACSGAEATFLLPVRTGGAWWHDWALSSDLLIWVRGRLTFEGAPHAAPFDSIIVRFDGSRRKTPRIESMGAKA